MPILDFFKFFIDVVKVPVRRIWPLKCACSKCSGTLMGREKAMAQCSIFDGMNSSITFPVINNLLIHLVRKCCDTLTTCKSKVRIEHPAPPYLALVENQN